ncbi:MAG: cyclic pyranopterin monophosphate synthase MoaC [Flavobacteriia bacterium]|nr:cyclic pyranopterin monophosphate synthase MoaC [Flavobacteriia bacterium]OIP46449.1 MAG: molybdenum cofactor biosynthesis protein C [Flavobacteriaceae bacterium CG2_30_31_66]PIV96558.1 MAG: cyclic pyranopterin monophosphate synthase MoaC [Flavobacteriaceae bacterium CG17_big_fil_post_rev_8_21_14_2_50_31_13]PIY16080.1 MAG: cyclic pyranopterin monophosphate synthase MoaC [Flavobacteriaceae bacterium CG_4_10_14_3_um_filter_31_253]PIZ09929.1 MAG: cyclic pyranopterin monophosphate synthase MoaC 
MSDFSHINSSGNPKMVNVSGKQITQRTAIAKATMFLGNEVISNFTNNELMTKKGPVFQTAIIAGIQAVKKTSELIPMCHPLLIQGVDIDIQIIDNETVEVICAVSIEGKTGVEMEALTGISVTCLTIYDMCKSISQKMEIRNIKLIEKKGGKSDIKNE